MHISLSFVVLTLLPFVYSQSNTLYSSLTSIPFLHQGRVTKDDIYNYLSISCGYLEPENVTAAQSSWGHGGGCAYLFSFNEVSQFLVEMGVYPLYI